MERFIGTFTRSVQLFFNIFTYGIEVFVIPWDQLSYPCVVNVCRLGLVQLYDTHLCRSENTEPDRTGISGGVRKAGSHWARGPGYRVDAKHLPAELMQEMC